MYFKFLKFADNMIYIKSDFNELYSHSVEIRCVSEDASKPVRTLSLRILRPTPTTRRRRRGRRRKMQKERRAFPCA